MRQEEIFDLQNSTSANGCHEWVTLKLKLRTVGRCGVASEAIANPRFRAGLENLYPKVILNIRIECMVGIINVIVRS